MKLIDMLYNKTTPKTYVMTDICRDIMFNKKPLWIWGIINRCFDGFPNRLQEKNYFKIKSRIEEECDTKEYRDFVMEQKLK